ncbi:MAG TPA: UDP-N-acetylmuramoyl-tripeptide--D-alanyl-D-alanine ligase [Candidatus Omnitrophota bacterium]|nr:UDP-N-acetylmuramoyl-tripeptide--D-alanyl-D-alanine ligase [Candidatus Omnitrophota bacterium]
MFKVKEVLKATGGELLSGTFPRSLAGLCIDTRTLIQNCIYVAIIGKKFDGHDFIEESINKGAKVIIYSNQEKIKTFKKNVAYLKVKDTVRALGDLALFHRRRFDIPIIAVTGSSGKTTTKEMIAGVLSARYNVHKNKGTQNNLIGVPLTLLEIHSRHDVCVLEMGTNKSGEIAELSRIAEPNVGVITNIGPAHLEFLGDLKGVYKEKIELIKRLAHPGIAILNKGDIYLSKLSKVRSKPLFFYGINQDCEFKATEITYKNQSIAFIFNGTHDLEIRHCALHNVSNALAAISCGILFGLEMNDIKQKIEAFDSPDMRLKEIKLKTCVVFDDSYNSNPQSLKQAIDVLCRQSSATRRILVMGDMLELGKKSEEFHAYFGTYVSKKSVDMLITMGQFSRSASESAKKGGMNTASIFHFNDCASVLEFLHNNIKEGDVVLVKGSRSMQMEKIVAALKEKH